MVYIVLTVIFLRSRKKFEKLNQRVLKGAWERNIRTWVTFELKYMDDVMPTHKQTIAKFDKLRSGWLYITR